MIVSRWIFFVGGDPSICLTVASLVSFRIAQWARTSRSPYSSLLAPQAISSFVFIPHGICAPPVQSSFSTSPAPRRNLFQYSVTDILPCLMCFSLILASPLASITPNCICSSALNTAQLSQVGVIQSSAYSVIHVPVSSLRRLVAYRIFAASWPFCHRTVPYYTMSWARDARSLCLSGR